jgi:hypothetical protein
MIVGSGASLDVSGTGTVNATSVHGMEMLSTGSGTVGKIPIDQGDGTSVWADPLVQGTKAEGAAIDNPVTIGGKDGSGNNKAFAVDSSGRPTVNVNGTVAISAASLPLPSGAATEVKQPALGTAGTPSSDVITVQGKTGMTAVKVDGSAVTQPVSASSLPLPTGASTSAKQPALGTAGTPSADVLTVQGAASMTALKVDGSAATQPVSVASLPLPTGAATESTLASLGATSSISHRVSAASNNAANIKSSAGTVMGWRIFNVADYSIYVKLYNKATSPTVGTDTPVQTIGVQAGTSADASGLGISYSTGISIAITKAITDADNTAVAASDCVVDIFYK